MREILFRGKRIDNDEWVEGNFYESGISGAFILQNKTRKTIDAKTGEITLRDEPIPFEVLPSTIGQYTGLKDKNGVYIFEGDIVDLFGMKGKVVQECGAFGIGFMETIDYDLLESKIPLNNRANFCFNDNFISLWEVFWNYEQDDNPLYEVDIIGNVQDNQELLEGGVE